jgi:hypothetical protein
VTFLRERLGFGVSSNDWSSSSLSSSAVFLFFALVFLVFLTGSVSSSDRGLALVAFLRERFGLGVSSTDWSSSSLSSSSIFFFFALVFLGFLTDSIFGGSTTLPLSSVACTACWYSSGKAPIPSRSSSL